MNDSESIPDIPGYTIIRGIGSGGSARVYLAVQQNLNRRVALKLVRGALTSDRHFGERFKREGRIVAQLNHPHIVPVYDIGEYQQHYYLAMEYLAGGDLLSQAGRMTLKELLEAMLQIATALRLAHQQGFIHRDIKPANILFRNPAEAVLTDFGIARKTESLTQMTVDGAMLGTPAYMSPQQINGEVLDGRADLYSLGVTLFEMLSGYQPYRSESIMNVALQHAHADIPRLPAGSARFQGLVERLLAKDCDERVQNAEALQAELQKLLDGDKSLAQPLQSLWPEQAPQPDSTYGLGAPPRRRKNSRLKWLAAASIFGLALTIIVMNWLQPNPSPMPIQAAPSTETPRQAKSVTPVRVEEAPVEPAAITEPVRPPWLEALAQADILYQQERLIEPEGGNALALYRQVLAQDDDNVAARNGERNIRQRQLLEVEQMIQAERLEQAGQKLALLDSLWSDDAGLQKLRERITAARERLEASRLAAAAAARQQQRIQAHLEAATAAMIEGLYLEPDDKSALFHFRQVLSLEPGNAQAKRGLKQVEQALATSITQAISGGEFARAESLIRALRGMNPGQASLQGSIDRLAAARQRQDQQRVEQQRALALTRQIDQLQRNVDSWQQGGETDAARARSGQGLAQEIRALQAQAPDDSRLPLLLRSVQVHLERLAQQSAQASASPPPPEPAAAPPQPERKPLIGGF